MKIALVSPKFPKSINDGVEQAEKYIKEASRGQAEFVCFPETFIPGMSGLEYTRISVSEQDLQNARQRVMTCAKNNNICVILPMEWYEEGKLMNVAFVISPEGKLLGCQTKNQLDPSEDKIYTPGDKRTLFDVNGLRFGIAICHEGWRYPETVRWAAVRGAQVVFHPHLCGSDYGGNSLKEWGAKDNPYYEKAMICRALENNIYFASVNFAMEFQDSATTIVSPTGKCMAHQNYGEEGILYADLDLVEATNLMAKRFQPELCE